MRISTSQFYQSGINAIGKQQSQLLSLYQQISSGRRMVTPADDPLAAAQTINIAQAKSLNERLAANRDVAMQNLSIEESVLTNVTLRYQDLMPRLIEASNGTLSDADRQTLAEVVSSLKDNLLALANSTDGNGQYLFSGHQGDRPAFSVAADGSIDWNGDQGKRLVQVDSTRQISSADDGLSIFMSAAKGSRVYYTAADSANQGTGVINSPLIHDPQGTHVGKDFAIEFSGSPLTYTVSVYDKQGGLLTSAPPELFDASAGSLMLPGGLSVNIEGTPAAGDSFSVRNSQGDIINIFDTLDSVVSALKTPVGNDLRAAANLRNTLTTASQLINVNYDAALTVRASIGVRMNEIEALNDAGVQEGLIYEGEISRLEGLDIYTATMNLNMRLAGLEAASSAFQKIQSLSLFSMRR